MNSRELSFEQGTAGLDMIIQPLCSGLCYPHFLRHYRPVEFPLLQLKSVTEFVPEIWRKFKSGRNRKDGLQEVDEQRVNNAVVVKPVNSNQVK